ncbi:MAG TPA: 30S ribosomal protein S6 [Patescibacteria group bacterium]|nr:30S ribosomal protein S6 [Patescibacteria group bacterium]
MNVYELAVIVKQDSAELLAKLEQIISNTAGKITARNNWGKKNFYYPIKKTKSGYYHLFTIEDESEKVGEMKKQLDRSEDVIRYLLIKVKK